MHNCRQMMWRGWGVGRVVALGLLVFGLRAPVLAQGIPVAEPCRMYVVPFVGGVWFGDLGEVSGRLLPPNGDLGDPPERITNLTLGAQAARLAGVTAGMAATRSLEIRFSAAFATTEFDLSGVTAADGDVEAFGTLGGLSSLDVISLRVDVLWRLIERGHPVSPYVVVGGGTVIYDLGDPADFFNLEPLTGIRLFPQTSKTSVVPAGVVGLGMDVPLSGRVGLRFEIADALSANGLESSDFEMSPRFVGLATAEDVAHNFLITVGVAVVLGGGAR